MKKAELKKLAKILDDIEVEQREYPGAGKKAIKEYGKISAILPIDLVRDLKELPRPLSHHMERAAKLYLLLLKER